MRGAQCAVQGALYLRFALFEAHGAQCAAHGAQCTVCVVFYTRRAVHSARRTTQGACSHLKHSPAAHAGLA
eukprot:11219784-Lingulodinium_polyedra.AAC.1